MARTKVRARVKTKVRGVAEDPDTHQIHLTRAVTTILFMETVLGSVKLPSSAPGRTGSLKGHEGPADLTKVIQLKKPMTLSFQT